MTTTKQLVKIKEVRLYTDAKTETATNIAAMKKVLEDNKIAYGELYYGEKKQHESVHSALNTWTFKNGKTVTLDKFPYVHWVECFNDWSTEIDIAVSVDELENLVKNKGLVE